MWDGGDTACVQMTDTSLLSRYIRFLEWQLTRDSALPLDDLSFDEKRVMAHAINSLANVVNEATTLKRVVKVIAESPLMKSRYGNMTEEVLGSNCDVEIELSEFDIHTLIDLQAVVGSKRLQATSGSPRDRKRQRKRN